MKYFFTIFLVLSSLWGCMTGSARGAETIYSPLSQANGLDNQNSFARPAAMGSAFVGISDDASALFTNPAGLSSLGRGQIWLNTHFWLVDTFQETALIGFPLSPHGAGAALSASYLSYGTLQGRDEAGSLAPNYDPYRLNLRVGAGIEILKGLALGAGLDGSQTKIADSSYWSFSSDMGVLARPFGSFQVGAAFVNLGLNHSPSSLSSTFHFGISNLFTLDKSNALLAAAGDSLTFDGANYLEAGVEYGLQKIFFLRAGYQQSLSDNEIDGLTGFTAGAGFAFSGLSLDYAYLPFGNLGTSHRISLSYQFGSIPTGNKAAPDPQKASGPVRDPLWTGNRPMAPGGGGLKNADAPQGSGLNFSPDTEAIPELQDHGGAPLSGQMGSIAPKAMSDAGAGDKDSMIVQFDMPSDSLSDGKDLEKQGQYQQAFRLYKAALRQNPRDASAWWALGNLYVKFNQKAPAVQCFERVEKLTPNSQKLADWLEKYKGSKP